MDTYELLPSWKVKVRFVTWPSRISKNKQNNSRTVACCSQCPILLTRFIFNYWEELHYKSFREFINLKIFYI